MTYVYVLKSAVNGDIYVGYTKDLRERVTRHNEGRVRSTRSNKPWILVYYEAYRHKTDAAKREVQLKKHKAKVDLLAQLVHSLNNET